MRRDTLYVATAGGMGPGTITGLEREIAGIASRGGVVVAATDADPAGEKYAARVAAMAEAAGVVAERAAPSGYKDWNEALKAHGQAPARPAHPRFSKALADVARADGAARTDASPTLGACSDPHGRAGPRHRAA